MKIMAGVRDLTDGDSAGLLTRVGSGGILGRRALNDPLADHLRPAEDVRYVLCNKRGPSVDGDPAPEPGSDYRALAAVTDLRVLFVAGRPDGDRTRDVHLSELVEAGAESEGLLSSALTLDAGARSYRFVCRGDTGPVAEYVDGAVADWGAIERRLDDAAAAVETAADAAAADDYGAALDALGAVEPRLAEAEDRAADLGPGADAAVTRRAGAVGRRHARARRRVLAGKAGTVHADAQTAWAERDYERAASRYETAVESYRGALAIEGPDPGDATLRARLSGAVRELTVLSAAPVADADTARRRAEAADRAGDAATAWETALRRYREALGLNWSGERRFRVDREAVRERAAEAAGGAVRAHRDAAAGWRTAGDDIASGQGRTEWSARESYERAREHLDRALDLAREVRPDAVDGIEADREALDRRLAGGRAGPPAPAVTPAGAGEQADDAVAGAADSDGWAAGVGLPDGLAPVATRPEGAGAAEEVPAAVERVRAAPDTAAAAAELADLDREELCEVVAAAWAERGWETTTAGTDAYDRLAVDGDVRLLWVVHEPEGAVGPAAVDRRASAREVFPEAAATLVTTGAVPPETRERAAEAGLEVVEAAGVAASLRGRDP